MKIISTHLIPLYMRSQILIWFPLQHLSETPFTSISRIRFLEPIIPTKKMDQKCYCQTDLIHV